MTPTSATLRLVDRADQGVCPNGHRCWLTSTGGVNASFRRSCLVGDYEGLPLIVEGTTEDDIDLAWRLGADPVIVDWARATIKDNYTPKEG